MSNLTYHRATTVEELNGILKLQEQNLREVLSVDDKSKDHSWAILKKCFDPFKSNHFGFVLYKNTMRIHF